MIEIKCHTSVKSFVICDIWSDGHILFWCKTLHIIAFFLIFTSVMSLTPWGSLMRPSFFAVRRRWINHIPGTQYKFTSDLIERKQSISFLVINPELTIKLQLNYVYGSKVIRNIRGNRTGILSRKPISMHYSMHKR